MDWMNMLLPIIMELVELVIKVLVIPVIVMGIKWLSDNIKNAIIRRVVEDAVRYAQQLYHEEGGEVKYEQALEQVVSILSKYGIELTEEELAFYIESILKKVKDEVGENW